MGPPVQRLNELPENSGRLVTEKLSKAGIPKIPTATALGTTCAFLDAGRRRNTVNLPATVHRTSGPSSDFVTIITGLVTSVRLEVELVGMTLYYPTVGFFILLGVYEMLRSCKLVYKCFDCFNICEE